MHVAPPDCRDAPTYWFVILEMSRKKGDRKTATQARRELRRLGVAVSFSRTRESARV